MSISKSTNTSTTTTMSLLECIVIFFKSLVTPINRHQTYCGMMITGTMMIAATSMSITDNLIVVQTILPSGLENFALRM
jgi:hypothetical protein